MPSPTTARFSTQPIVGSPMPWLPSWPNLRTGLRTAGQSRAATAEVKSSAVNVCVPDLASHVPACISSTPRTVASGGAAGTVTSGIGHRLARVVLAEKVRIAALAGDEGADQLRPVTGRVHTHVERGPVTAAGAPAVFVLAGDNADEQRAPRRG